MSEKGTEKRWWSQSKDFQEMENSVGSSVQAIHQGDQPDSPLCGRDLGEMNDVYHKL